jgi:hypothetical protein
MIAGVLESLRWAMPDKRGDSGADLHDLDRNPAGETTEEIKPNQAGSNLSKFPRAGVSDSQSKMGKGEVGMPVVDDCQHRRHDKCNIDPPVSAISGIQGQANE